MLRAIALGLAIVSALGAGVSASDHVGVDRCAGCHEAIARSWRTTAHARALARLSRSEAGKTACRSCHATGDAPAGRSDLAGVQCEACHGAGADYAPEDVMRDRPLSRALGLRDLSTPARRAAVCMRCHASATRLAPFDPEAAWRRIAH